MGQKKSDETLPLTRRGELRVGFRCNARCGFCYYKDLLDTPADKDPDTEKLKRKVLKLKKMGAQEIEFTGGEPTIHRGLPELVRYSHELGFKNISLISNGLRLANPNYALRLAESGLNDSLISIHGHSSTLHDLHTSIPGSYNKAIQTLYNLRKLGIRRRITCTVTRSNVAHLEEILTSFCKHAPASIHFAVYSPVAQAGSEDERYIVSYEEAAEALKKAIDKVSKEGALPPLSIKYIPLCFMKGYERFVMNLYQQNFDPDDWNYYFSNKLRRATVPIVGQLFDLICAAGSLISRNRSTAWSYGWFGAKVFGFTRIVELLRKKRIPQCQDCRYDRVCDHVWSGYLAKFGTPHLSPIKGDLITHPAWSYELARTRKPGIPLTQTEAGTSQISLLEVTR